MGNALQDVRNDLAKQSYTYTNVQVHLAPMAHEVDGAQIGIVYSTADAVDGVQVSSLANYAATEINGVQLAAGLCTAATARGVQLAAGATLADRANGVQAAIFANAADTVNGVQLAAFNVAENEVNGADHIATYHERTAQTDELNFRAVNASGTARTIDWATVAVAAFPPG